MATKSFLIGVGGTLIYYALLFLVGLGGDGADSTVHLGRYEIFQFIGKALLVPLLPGLLPGLLIAGILAQLGIIGGDFHDGGWLYASFLSAPLVHSYFVHRWLKRRQKDPATQETSG